MLIPCDNLPDNGKRLKAALVALAAKSDAGLADWIAAHLTCPCTMVDSITPATDDALRARVTEATGLQDNWPIQREAFTQWVIEAHDNPDGPDWAGVGVTLTDNVPAFERAKLRLLNGPHSTLAYVGSLKGYETVYEAMQDAELAGFVRALMLEDIAPLLAAPSGMDLPGYCEAILKRFRNPAIRHLLAQIAWDGSQKLPIRILASLTEALEHELESSLGYLAPCDVCDPARLLRACNCCDLHDKEVDVPALVLGFRAARQPDEAQDEREDKVDATASPRVED